ncbi:alpha/beta fold hydrolase [Sphingobium sp. YR768]|uniref:alpha/beta fold hydrolase n=1 Tax=Sphingobium sp. YR768 TaxID=1884365 RepID=UPI0008AFF76E|nr:alpha/beta fold hydrolase [Sphingobium sp. YR768]SES12866.1 Pimeloyl-ACP methyl ester carboxylesterase [Sphingobium sp. YR768]
MKKASESGDRERSGASASFYVDAAGARIECAWFGNDIRGESEPIILLHHGFGSVTDWRNFPAALARLSSRPVLAYSRRGCGISSPRAERHDLAYLRKEALIYLPALLDGLGITRCHLVGHSDGATIALQFATAVPHRSVSCAAIAPHVFAERGTISGVAALRQRYVEDDSYRQRVARWHKDGDGAFFGWADVWLDAGFEQWSIVEEMRHLTVPTTIIQGNSDPFGSAIHAQLIDSHAALQPQIVMIKGGHNPHVEDQARAIEAIVKAF